jgi:hypothetical protein
MITSALGALIMPVDVAANSRLCAVVFIRIAYLEKLFENCTSYFSSVLDIVIGNEVNTTSNSKD